MSLMNAAATRRMVCEQTIPDAYFAMADAIEKAAMKGYRYVRVTVEETEVTLLTHVLIDSGYGAMASCIDGSSSSMIEISW